MIIFILSRLPLQIQVGNNIGVKPNFNSIQADRGLCNLVNRYRRQACFLGDENNQIKSSPVKPNQNKPHQTPPHHTTANYLCSIFIHKMQRKWKCKENGNGYGKHLFLKEKRNTE